MSSASLVAAALSQVIFRPQGHLERWPQGPSSTVVDHGFTAPANGAADAADANAADMHEPEAHASEPPGMALQPWSCMRCARAGWMHSGSGEGTAGDCGKRGVHCARTTHMLVGYGCAH